MRSTVTDSESSNVVHRTAILTPTPPPLRGGGETHYSQFSACFCSPSPLAERGLGGEGIAARRLRARQRDFFSSLLGGRRRRGVTFVEDDIVHHPIHLACAASVTGAAA